MERKGICVAGSLIADRYFEVDTYPGEGLLSTVRSTETHIGGLGNLILDLARLDDGLPVKVCAVVGKDDSGKDLLAALSRHGNINTDDIVREGDSSVTFVINASDTKQRTFFFLPGASDVFDESKIHWENIPSRIFHLEYLLLMKKVDAPDGEYGTHGARILARARKEGMITSVDMVSEQSGRVRDVVRPALRYTDICCINESEAQAITGIEAASGESARQALQELRHLGVSRWAVIHSPKHNYGYDCMADRFVSVDSLTLPPDFIKGTTGAGDAFCSGILYGAHSGYDLEEAMKLAIGCAAFSLSECNGTDGMRRLEEVWALFEKLC
ncbi:MAG: carbohydrate kinase family protein [Clostridiales bacterium]|nr:carbohydrate kinase family protein [Clostridiales bacterium]